MVGFITGAFAFTAALAWNNTILAVFQKVFGSTTGIIQSLVYAIVVSSVAVLVTYLISRALREEEKQ